MEFINQTDLEFIDISSELWRSYLFTHDSYIRIDKPLKLHVSENGHRIFDSFGYSYYIPKGWICIKWQAKEGEPHFVK